MRVALVLGSGGARGYAHIGVIQVLREQGHEIVAIAGTSMGAVVGSVAAAGQLDPFTDWVTSLRQRDVLRLLDVKLSAPGLIGADKVIERLRSLTGDIAIEDLPIPFTAVATDLEARREVWFQRGPLATAVRASIAIPGVFTPIEVGGRLLVDGGVLNPVPIDPMAAVDADFTVAVTLSGPRSVETDAAADDPPADVDPDGASQPAPGRVRGIVSSVRRGRADTVDTSLGMVDLALYSLDTMGAAIARHRLAARPPDVLVSIPFNACGTLDFLRAPEMIEIGRQRAIDALERADRLD